VLSDTLFDLAYVAGGVVFVTRHTTMAVKAKQWNERIWGMPVSERFFSVGYLCGGIAMTIIGVLHLLGVLHHRGGG